MSKSFTQHAPQTLNIDDSKGPQPTTTPLTTLNVTLNTGTTAPLSKDAFGSLSIHELANHFLNTQLNMQIREAAYDAIASSNKFIDQKNKDTSELHELITMLEKKSLTNLSSDELVLLSLLLQATQNKSKKSFAYTTEATQKDPKNGFAWHMLGLMHRDGTER